MLAIEIELLSGRYVATEVTDRSRAEWPPHPARFFSALVAALHDHEPVDPDERRALLWLEQQPAPELDVELHIDDRVGRRQVRSVFVPVNDVTLVGDPEAAVREAQERLAKLEQGGQDNEVATAVRRARKELVKQRAKFSAFIAAQRVVDRTPTARAIKAAEALLPDRRIRQERTFPIVVPERSTFAFLWTGTTPANHVEALQQLCDRVTRLGHSSSLVRCMLVDRSIEPSLVPRSTGQHVLRVVGPGQLARLEALYERHQAVDARVLPARPQRYGTPEADVPQGPHSVFTDEWIVLERIGGGRPLSSRGSHLAVGLRQALIDVHGKEELPPVISGCHPSGEQSHKPHVAFVALPWVGHEHADGSVQGMALVAPRVITAGEREAFLRLLAKWEAERGDVTDDYSVGLDTPSGLGRPLQVQIRRVEVPSKAALRATRWCRPSHRYITATPIALDRHPGKLRSNVHRAAHKAADEAETSIADACERIGLPRPLHVSISFTPLLSGAQHVRQFAPWPPWRGETRRALVHADIVFPVAVRGPVLLGAGRYFGLGLCLPVALLPSETRTAGPGATPS